MNGGIIIYPTVPFTILKTLNLLIDGLYEV